MVALLNYSIVQSAIGSAIGSHFSREWGGTVKVGSVHIDPFNHLTLRNVLLVSPVGNDTVFRSERISCRFSGLPVADGGIKMRSVVLHNTMFHLTSTTRCKSFRYIVEYFRERNRKKEKEMNGEKEPFVVDIKDVVLDNVCYRMTLDTIPYYANREHGVDVANMVMDSVCAHITNLRVVNDHVICHIVKMSTVERSGWRMKKLAGDVDVSGKGIHVTNMQLQTGDMNMQSDVHLVYDSWKSLDWYCDSVDMDVTFKKGNKLSMQDAAYWAPSLWGCDDPVYIEGHVTGPVANLRVENFNINFGQKTHLYLDGTVCGLPYVEGTFFDVHLHQLRTDMADLLALHHPGSLNIGAPKIYEGLGTIDIMAELVGGADKCMAYFDISTALGKITTTAKISRESAENRIKAALSVKSDNMELPSLAKNEWVSHTGFDITVDAVGSNLDNLKAKLDAKLKNTTLVGNNIDRATLTATLDKRQCRLDMRIDDPVLDLAAQGKVALPKDAALACQMDIGLENADLRRLKLIKCDSLCSLSAHIHSDITVPTSSDPTGIATISQLVLRQDEKSFRLNKAHIEASERNNKKQITVTSDLADLHASGCFNYSHLPIIAKRICHDHIPAYWQQHFAPTSDAENKAISSTNLKVNIDWKDPTKQLQFFLPALDITQGTTLSTTYDYNSRRPLDLVFDSKAITYGSLTLHNIGIISHSIDSSVVLGADISEITLGAKTLLNDLHLRTSVTNESTAVTFNWDSDDKTVINSCSDSITVVMYSDTTDNSLEIKEPHFFINGERWTLNNAGSIKFNKNRIDIDNLTLASGSQYITFAYHHTAEHTNDSAHAKFKSVNLSTIGDLVTKNSGFSTSGKINGDADIVWGTNSSAPIVKSNITIEDCMVNDHQLGDMKLEVNHNANEKLTGLGIFTEVTEGNKKTHPLKAIGIANFSGESPDLAFSADFDKFDLVVLSPLLKSFSSRFEGYLSGHIGVSGSLKDPIIRGTAIVDSGIVKIDATNVEYTFNDTIHLDSNCIRLNRFTLRDAGGNPAHITGRIKYHGFSDISIDHLRLTTPRILVYNSSNSSARGVVYADVGAVVDGHLPSLDIQARARTLKGSRLIIPITSQRSISNADFITFVSDDDDEVIHVKSDIRKKNTGNSKSTINVNIDITPDLDLQVPMDMSPVSLDIGGSGNGTLSVSLMPSRDMQINGTYSITHGKIKLNLLSLVTREFDIERGSTVEFPGNVNDATLNVNAIYRVRVDVNPLLGESENSVAHRPVPVESVVSLQGKLKSPDMRFGIRLPDADQSLQDEVFAVIDTTNANERLNQTIYLLVSGKFNNANQTSNEETNLASTGISTVVNALGSVVTGMIEFVDINFDYTAAKGTRGEQYSVGINKHWNKFYIESTLGYGGYDQDLSSGEALANNIVGDILLGYTFNQKLHMFIFNRSNTNDYTRFEMPYKQGLGLKYTHDFDKWSELLKRKAKKKKTTPTTKAVNKPRKSY